MNKLQQGDYVTDLTEEQYNELMVIESNRCRLHCNSIFFDGCNTVVLWDFTCGFNYNKLTFEEFRERAINTFGDE